MENKKKYELVLKAYHNAYAKYSNFSVGALVITKDDNYYLGANIENASYGLSNCAERSALFSAYSNSCSTPPASRNKRPRPYSE